LAATLREISKRTGVSVSTVSRVLNDHSGVSADVRERVLKVATELDYTPNAAARTLVLKRSHLLTVVIRTGDDREFEHPYYQVVLDGIKHQATKRGYDLYILSHAGETYGEDSNYFVSRARRHQVDGAVVMGVRERDVEEFVKLKIPVMTVDFEPTGKLEKQVGVVQSDNFAGGELAVAHLHSLGRTRIAHIAGTLHTAPGMRRLAGYRNGLDSAELPFREEYVVEGDFTYEQGCAAMRKLLSLPEPPDAVFAAADMMALGAMRAVHDVGLQTPDDVAVVGFDDIHFASLSVPALTTIRQHKEKIGELACEALIDLIEGRKTVPPRLTLPVDLVVRESCGGGKQTSEDPLTFEPITAP
jgi:DNA-binding LacI/PurR family transcriptional regulator